MKLSSILFTFILLASSLIAQTKQTTYPSYDHNGDAKRVKRETPTILSSNERILTNCDFLSATSPFQEIIGCSVDAAKVSFKESYNEDIFEPIIYLQDDSSPTHLLFISPTGEYFLTFGIGAIQVRGIGRVRIKGDSITLEHTTSRYRILATGKLSDFTGKATLNYYSIATYHITDRIKQYQDEYKLEEVIRPDIIRRKDSN